LIFVGFEDHILTMLCVQCYKTPAENSCLASDKTVTCWCAIYFRESIKCRKVTARNKHNLYLLVIHISLNFWKADSMRVQAYYNTLCDVTFVFVYMIDHHC